MEHKSNWHTKVPFGLLFIETSKSTKNVNQETLAKTKEKRINKWSKINLFIGSIICGSNLQ